MLTLDAGDDLFADGKPDPSERDRAKARLIVDSMAALGTDAMTVGERDLAAGLPFLLEQRTRAHLPILAANLKDAKGERPFPASRMFSVGDQKVGVVGVTAAAAPDPFPRGITLTDPVRAARDEAKGLHDQGASLVVALVHGPMDVYEAVSRIAGIDLVVSSHDGGIRAPYFMVQAWVVPSGQRGRTLRRFTVDLAGSGKLVDGDAVKRAHKEADDLQARIADARSRAEKASTEAEKVALNRVADDWTRRAEEMKSKGPERAGPGRVFNFENEPLGTEYPDEPKLAALVRAFETRYPAPPETH